MLLSQEDEGKAEEFTSSLKPIADAEAAMLFGGYTDNNSALPILQTPRADGREQRSRNKRTDQIIHISEYATAQTHCRGK